MLQETGCNLPLVLSQDETKPCPNVGKGFLGMSLYLSFKACSHQEPVIGTYIRQNPTDSNLSHKPQVVGDYVFTL